MTQNMTRASVDAFIQENSAALDKGDAARMDGTLFHYRQLVGSQVIDSRHILMADEYPKAYRDNMDYPMTRVGENVVLGKGTSFFIMPGAEKKFEIGSNTIIMGNTDNNANISGRIGSNVVIGSNVTVETEASVGDGSIIGERSNITSTTKPSIVGTQVTIGRKSTISEATVENGVTIGDEVLIFSSCVGYDSQIGNKVQLSSVNLMSSAVVEDGVRLESSKLGQHAKIAKGARISSVDFSNVEGVEMSIQPTRTEIYDAMVRVSVADNKVIITKDNKTLKSHPIESFLGEKPKDIKGKSGIFNFGARRGIISELEAAADKYFSEISEMAIAHATKVNERRAELGDKENWPQIEGVPTHERSR